MMKLLIAFLTHIVTFGPSDLSDSGKSFLDGEDDDGEDGGEDDDSAGDAEDQGDEGDTDGDTDDEDSDDDDGEDADDDDEDDSESDEEDSDESGDEAGEEDLEPPVAGASALALEQAVKSRLTTEKAGSTTAGELDVEVPTLEELQRDFPEMHEDDLTGIRSVSAHIIKKALRGYDDTRVKPVITASDKNARAALLEQGVRTFMDRYPNAFARPGVEAAMSAKYQELAADFDVEYADSVTVEEYYLMIGGQDKPQQKPVGKSTKKAAAQKRKSRRAVNTPGSIARVKTGGKRKGSGERRLLKKTAATIQRTQFNPFEMPTS